MKNTFKLLTAVTIATVMGCGNSQQNSNEISKTDTTTLKKTDMISQKITPSI